MALSNAETATNTTLSDADRDMLRVILTHWCRWSATYTKHVEESWVRCLKATYGKDNLKPILDTLFYEEELSKLPPEVRPTAPSMFLLANSQSYFVFVLEDQTFCSAGATLREVYDGLRDLKWHGDKDGDWPLELEVGPVPCDLDIFRLIVMEERTGVLLLLILKQNFRFECKFHSYT
jgi:hypothetical protein